MTPNIHSLSCFFFPSFPQILARNTAWKKKENRIHPPPCSMQPAVNMGLASDKSKGCNIWIVFEQLTDAFLLHLVISVHWNAGSLNNWSRVHDLKAWQWRPSSMDNDTTSSWRTMTVLGCPHKLSNERQKKFNFLLLTIFRIFSFCHT